MTQTLYCSTLLVHDNDAAIDFFARAMRFTLLADAPQAGGRMFQFLHSSDFAADHAHMQAQGVRFREVPREEPYGTVAVFEDLCGNPWDLLQPGVH